ncbi:MAG: phenylalanine--tRNA ligase subunit beta [Flavobacteriales bacterium]
MKIAYNWLSNYIKTDLSLDRISEILTDIGLEVEGVEQLGGTSTDFTKIVVGKVMSCEQHPNADKLKVCQLDVGQEELLSIVCGAPNVAENQKVICALHGSVLNPTGAEKPLKIKKGKIRGERSQGMICALDELGIGSNHDGIHVLNESAEIGGNPKDFLDLDEEFCIEIGLTPNRADAMSHFGVARDLKAYCDVHNVDYTWTNLEAPELPNSSTQPIAVDIQSDACYRYAGLAVKGIEVKESPEWLKKSLQSIGLEPINNIVDLSNYIMHDIGQPLHIFDLEQIEGQKVVVRQAKADEEFLALDGRTLKLKTEDLVIADANKPMCIAGVMGGENSGVQTTTTSIFIESAYFSPVSVRKSAKRHGFHTDASFRFERGIDFETVDVALKRTFELLKKLCPDAEICHQRSDQITHQIEPFEFDFDLNQATKLIGEEIDIQVIKSVLSALDIQILEETDSVFKLSVPSFRNDVYRQADVVEEILRLVGFNSISIPSQFKASLEMSDKIDENALLNKLSDTLVANGFNEAMNNSLTKSTYLNCFEEHKAEQAVEILNPLSQDLAFMRQSLLPGLIENTAYNFNRQVNGVRFFEFGKTYNQFNGKYHESKRLALLISGEFSSSTWLDKKKPADFYVLKSELTNLLAQLGLETRCKQKASSFSGFSQGIQFLVKKQVVAQIGEVKPSLSKACGLKNAKVYFAELFWDTIISCLNAEIKFEALAKFPSVKRDLALLMDKEVQFTQLENIAFQTDKNILKHVEIFDVYTGSKVDEGKKSYALSFYFQDQNKTLTDKQVDQSILKIYTQFQKQLGVELRDGELKA